MNHPIANLNGEFIAQDRLQLPANDAGFVLGATVTDLCRTFRHQLYRLPDHLARFRQSCSTARIPQPLPDIRLQEIGEELVEHNAPLLEPEQDLALVMFATPGPIGYYLGQHGGAGEGTPTLGMHTFPLPFGRYRGLFERGAHLEVPSIHHVSAQCIDPRIKQRSRLHWWLADREAEAIQPGASALLLDEADCLTETASSNILLVLEGKVVSPPRQSILNGISLLVVEELCGSLGIPFLERPITFQDAKTAQEGFLSCTSYCLAGIRQINQIPLNWPGPIFKSLLAAWSKQVGVDISRQILSNP